MSDVATRHVPTSSSWKMANRILKGRLIEFLEERRHGRGESFDQIAKDLYGQGVEVSSTTVGAWCQILGIEPPRSAAS